VKFDQLTKLTENFDQLKMSSEIRSSDRFPFELLFIKLEIACLIEYYETFGIILSILAKLAKCHDVVFGLVQVW
jgi:hypothetical protein